MRYQNKVDASKVRHPDWADRVEPLETGINENDTIVGKRDPKGANTQELNLDAHVFPRSASRA
jgi:hypothetical protein